MTQAYPLHWPEGRPRTNRPQSSRFDTTFATARNALMVELSRLGVRDKILSTNVELRLDGIPYASRREPEDGGVAVYFKYKGRPMCFACDRWDKVKDNIQAVRKTIEALRGIKRWGSGNMLQQAFTGFMAIVGPDTKKPWHHVLGISPDAHHTTIRQAHKALARKHHSDVGGTDSLMAEINAARDEGLKANG